MRFFMDGSGRSPNAGWSWRNTTLVAGMALLSSLAVGIGAAGGLSVLDEPGEPPPPAPAEAKARALVPLPVDPDPPSGGNPAEVTEPPTKAESAAGPTEEPGKRPTESHRPDPDAPGLGDLVDEDAPAVEAEGEAEPEVPRLPESHCPDKAPSWLHVGGELPQLREWNARWEQLDLGELPGSQWSGDRGSVPDWDAPGSVPDGSGSRHDGGDSPTKPAGSGWGNGDFDSASGHSGWGERDSGSDSAGSDGDGGGWGSRSNGSGWD